MGKRTRDRQLTMWVPTTDLPTAASHPFYQRLNQLLREHGFDDFVEAQCAGFYAETIGRPGLPPGIYLRLRLIGYFEGIDAERGIAWRAADSLALRDSLGIRAGSGTAGPLDDCADATAHCARNASGRLHVDPAVSEHGRLGQRQDDRRGRHDAGSERRIAEHHPTRQRRKL